MYFTNCPPERSLCNKVCSTVFCENTSLIDENMKDFKSTVFCENTSLIDENMKDFKSTVFCENTSLIDENMKDFKKVKIHAHQFFLYFRLSRVLYS